MLWRISAIFSMSSSLKLLIWSLVKPSELRVNLLKLNTSNVLLHSSESNKLLLSVSKCSTKMVAHLKMVGRHVRGIVHPQVHQSRTGACGDVSELGKPGWSVALFSIPEAFP